MAAVVRALICVAIGCAALSGCGGPTPQVGDPVVVNNRSMGFSPRCGEFPRLARVGHGVGGGRGAIMCRDGAVEVSRYRRVSTFDRVLTPAARLIPIAIWGCFAMTFLGLLWRDPLGVNKLRRGIETFLEENALRADGADGRLPVIAPVHCPDCAAPLPLSIAERVECPHCHASAELPAELRETVRQRNRAEALLGASAQLWRVYDRLSQSGWVVLLVLGVYLAMPVFLVATVYGVAEGILRPTYGTFGVAWAFVSLWTLGPIFDAPLRKELTSALDATSLPAAAIEDGGSCRRCGSTLQAVSPAETIVSCPFCGSHHLLRSRLARGQAITTVQADGAATDLLVATITVQDYVLKIWSRLYFGSWLVLLIGGLPLALC